MDFNKNHILFLLSIGWILNCPIIENYLKVVKLSKNRERSIESMDWVMVLKKSGRSVLCRCGMDWIYMEKIGFLLEAGQRWSRKPIQMKSAAGACYYSFHVKKTPRPKQCDTHVMHFCGKLRAKASKAWGRWGIASIASRAAFLDFCGRK